MDGTFCLKKIEELKPNVVTLDLEMPGMNGIDTLKEIMRRNPFRSLCSVRTALKAPASP